MIVDTTLPRIDELQAHVAENGAIEIQARVADSNLDPSTWKFEWQADSSGSWLPVTLQGAAVQPIGNTGLPLGGSALHAFWQPPAGTRPIALRGTVMDRAGNSATYQTRLDAGSTVSGPLLGQPGVGTVAAPRPIAPTLPAPVLPGATASQAIAAAQGWVSGSVGSTAPAQAAQAAALPASQPWPAVNATRAPFQLWTNGTAPQDDGVTSYGSPQLFAAPPVSAARSDSNREEHRVEATYAGITKSSSEPVNGVVPSTQSRPQFATLEPYRESSTNRAAAPAVQSSLPTSKPIARDVTPIDSPTLQHSPPSVSKQVGSRTFALEYDLDDAGRGGVSKVELWGTRDGGKNWTKYAQDDDNRSPLIVTVDDEGLYGFRILVQNAGGAAAEPPRPGDSPELWVSVDLKRPVVELTAIERGQGNEADHLILRWRAVDNNLEAAADRPVL